MIVIHVRVKVKRTADKDFEQVLREVVAEARRTTGCQQYEWYRHPDNAQDYAILGEYDGKENFVNYLNSAVVKRIESELIPLLDAPPEFKHYEATIFESN
jgi:quinol monooxygenase YgiN